MQYTNCYASKPYERTKIGLCYRLFYDQCFSSRKRNHNPPAYTKEELTHWIQSQSNFEELYQGWVDSNYSTQLRPSCDRLDNSIGYSFSNIELVTFAENCRRANIDTINGSLGSHQVEVFQYNLDGTFKAKYHSMNAAASSEDGLDQRNISSCCRGIIGHAYRYFWSYKFLGDKIPAILTKDTYYREIFQYCAFTGLIQNVYDDINSISSDSNTLCKVRASIKHGIQYKGSYYLFDYLSPEEVISRLGVPKQKPINVYDSEHNLLCTCISANEVKKQFGISDTQVARLCKNNTQCKTTLLYFEYKF